MPSKITIDMRAWIEKQPDPIGIWIKIAKCEKFKAGAPDNPLMQTDWYPTLDQMMDAQARLLNEILPDLPAVEISNSED